MLVIACPAIATAATTVHLPTDGYVRPGRYFPIEVRADAPAHLTADGCVPCDVAAGWFTVPMLAAGAPGDLHGGDDPPVPFRVPADDERLVASTGPLPAGAADLFPSCRIVPVRLDPANPLPGPPAAWEVLDGLVLDAPAMAAVTDERRSALLAGGVALIVTGSDAAPDDRWPWQRRGPLWALAYRPAGPAGTVVLPDAYEPTDGWTPSWPAAVRGTAGAAAVVVVVAAIALAVLRTRWAVVAAIALPCVATAAATAWRTRLDPVARGGGDVTITSPGRWSQRDAWAYERARSPADATVPWNGSTHPAFPSESAIATDRARLTVAADGSLAFTLHLSAGSAMAFVRRDVTVADAPLHTGGHDAVMRAIAPLYLSTGDRLVGETPPAAGRWPGVVISRGK
jgi:hypothetical protein